MNLLTKIEMRNLLVPIDFSDNSRAAFIYAVNLAKDLNLTLTVLHCYHPVASQVNNGNYSTDDELQLITSKELSSFISKSLEIAEIEFSTVNAMIEQRVVPGFAAEKIVEISKTRTYDLIVMGTRGSSGILTNMFGKVSLFVSKSAKCPVLLIPSKVSYTKIHDIMFASEDEIPDKFTLIQLMELSIFVDAQVHLVHVCMAKDTKAEFLMPNIVEEEVRKAAPGLNLSVVSVFNQSVANGLLTYATSENMDWMLIVKPQKNLWERLVHKSRTDKIILDPVIPLLIMHN